MGKEWNWRTCCKTLKTYYKELWYLRPCGIDKNDRNIDQWIRLQSPEIDPKFMVNWFWKSANAFNEAKIVFSTSGTGTTECPHGK